MDSQNARDRHLTDAELFTLAVPPAGEPEALPGHLSECLSCTRALSEWKTAVRDLSAEDSDALSRRSAQEWEALEEKTLAAIRRSRLRQHRLSWRWLATIAAALMLLALALPLRKSLSPAAPGRPAKKAELSAQDQVDDRLLRDVARLSRGEEASGAWNSLAPEPEGSAGNEEKL